MKSCYLLTIGLAMCAAAQPPGSDPKMKNAIIIDGKMYVMKFADQNQNVVLNEYYQQAETPDNWTTMVSVAVYLDRATPAEFAKRIEQNLLQSHPDAPHDIAVDPGSGEALFMCLNWVGDNRKTTSEYTVYRFRKHPRGVLAYQMSLRPYQAKMSSDDFKALRDRWAKTIQHDQWPPDVIAKK
jgi:hypothetical protein